MEDIDLLEAIGIASMFGGGGDSVLSASADDLLDPGGYYRSQGLDPYGRPLSGVSKVSPAGAKPTTAVGKGTAAMKTLGSKLNALRQGYEAGVTPLVRNQTAAIGKGVRGASKLMGFSPSAAGNAGRMAMQALNNPLLQTGLKYAPVVGSALAVGDLVFGDESLGNKAVDAAAMTAGGLLGSVVPVVGTGLGIAAGKMVSDGLQGIFGGTPKEQRLAEALSQLEGGRI